MYEEKDYTTLKFNLIFTLKDAYTGKFTSIKKIGDLFIYLFLSWYENT